MAETSTDYRRKFLVVIDESPECDRAVTFASYRVRRTGGTVVLLTVIDTADFQQYLGVGDVMRAEAEQEAQRLVNQRVNRIAGIGGNIAVEAVIREGRAVDEVQKLIADDPGIAILVLAASTASEGPGPLVSAFAAHSVLPIPVTIVPGSMTDEAIIAVC